KSYSVLVSALSDPSPEVRAAAVDALAQIGRPVVPAVRLALAAADPHVRKMAAVVLSRVDRGEFCPLVDAQMMESLRTIYRNHGRLEALAPCARYRGVAVLQSALREQNRQLIAEIFYLLAATRSQGVVRVITESLQSEEARVRANAVEALESLATTQ